MIWVHNTWHFFFQRYSFKNGIALIDPVADWNPIETHPHCKYQAPSPPGSSGEIKNVAVSRPHRQFKKNVHTSADIINKLKIN
jgi:hypothetical protein